MVAAWTHLPRADLIASGRHRPAHAMSAWSSSTMRSLAPDRRQNLAFPLEMRNVPRPSGLSVEEALASSACAEGTAIRDSSRGQRNGSPSPGRPSIALAVADGRAARCLDQRLRDLQPSQTTACRTWR
jgi:hypothetical protein